VLPNMDDIAFFDSSSYPSRGGIWPDAGRREKPDVSHETSMSSSVDHVDASTVSAPHDVDSSTISSGDHSDVKRSNSEGDVIVTSPHPSSPHRSATVPLSRDPSPTPDPSHQHSFSPHGHHSPEHHPPAEDPDSSTEAALLEVQHPLLRHKSSSSSEKSKRRFLGIRRGSPSSGLGSRPSSHAPSPTPSLENLRTLSPEPRHSSSPPPDAGPTRSPVPSGQSSLFSTLKSRAGDRQALSNTAKETMRKWTVNWGGLKKDHRDSSAASSVHTSVASSVHTQDGRDNKHHSTSQKVKSSYAEIRAAVDGRKEGRRRSSEGPSAPIRIPNHGHKGRTGSISSLHHPQGSSLSSSQTESSSAGWSADPWVVETSSDLASQPPPAIDVDGTQVDSETVNGNEPAPAMTTLPPVPLPPRPIQSQPSQGKTMSIPGIHARNRGEVMSMGYAPPSPPAPAETKTGVSSVYRLWKYSPAGHSEQLDGDGNAEHAGTHSPPVLTADSAEALPEPTPTSTTRPQAPPLPPRAPVSLHPVSSDSSTLSPASVALKSIASRDECRTQDGEGVDTSSSPPVSPKPPLPPRKIHVPA
jgi:hypothetical protein